MTQISAHISDELKQQLEFYVKKRGVKRTFLIEQALLHHLRALNTLPDDVIIPVKIVVSEDSMESVVNAMDSEPTAELRQLMNG